MSDIVQFKIKGLNPLQWSAKMDLATVKAQYGNHLSLIGNISTTTTLPHGTPLEVEREVLESLCDAGSGGGFVMAPDHSYHSAISFENTWAVLDTCKKYGVYPLDMDAIQTRLQELTQS